MAHAIKIAGVEEVYTDIERLVKGGDALGTVGGTIDCGHAHAAKAEGGNLRASAAQRTLLDHGKLHLQDNTTIEVMPHSSSCDNPLNPK